MVGILYILVPYDYIEAPLGPKYILYSYMDPLGEVQGFHVRFGVHMIVSRASLKGPIHSASFSDPIPTIRTAHP